MAASTDITQRPATVINRLTGEQLTVTEAPTIDLAAYLDDLATIRAALADEETLVQHEIRGRLDANLAWTEHVDSDDRAFTLSCPSPTAGTTGYRLDVLRDGLRDLVASGLLTAAAARGAVTRSITASFIVDVDVDTGPLVAQLERTTALLQTPVWEVRVTTAEKVAAAGVQRLAKMGGSAAALVVDASVLVEPPARRVKVESRAKR